MFSEEFVELMRHQTRNDFWLTKNELKELDESMGNPERTTLKLHISGNPDFEGTREEVLEEVLRVMKEIEKGNFEVFEGFGDTQNQMTVEEFLQ